MGRNELYCKLQKKLIEFAIDLTYYLKNQCKEEYLLLEKIGKIRNSQEIR